MVCPIAKLCGAVSLNDISLSDAKRYQVSDEEWEQFNEYRKQMIKLLRNYRGLFPGKQKYGQSRHFKDMNR